MVAFKTPLRGQQELTLLGSEKTTSLLVVFILQTVSSVIVWASAQSQ